MEKYIKSKMLNEGEELNDAYLAEEDVLEDEEMTEAELTESAGDKKMSDHEIRVEALKIATNMAKLMSDVTTEDIINIADKVAAFIKDHQIGEDEEPEEEPIEEEPEEGESKEDMEKNIDVEDLEIPDEEDENTEE